MILLIQASHAEHNHAALLVRAGFAVKIGSIGSIDNEILITPPAVIAIELEPSRCAETFKAAKALRMDPRLRNTPIIVYATWLSADHIEMAAQSGLLWLQITPVDKLVAAIRGLLSAAESAG